MSDRTEPRPRGGYLVHADELIAAQHLVVRTPRETALDVWPDAYPETVREWRVAEVMGHERYCQGWDDGHRAGLADAAEEQRAQALHEQAARAAEAAAAVTGPEHDERRARERVGRARAVRRLGGAA